MIKIVISFKKSKRVKDQNSQNIKKRYDNFTPPPYMSGSIGGQRIVVKVSGI